MAEDFVKDGLLHCGVCGKPKEHRYSVLGFESVAPVQCDCEAAVTEEFHNKWKEEQRMMRIERLIADGIQDKERRMCRFENAEMNDDLKKCLKYVENWKEMKAHNAGLLMWGPCGNGKSFAAACIANALIEQNIPVLMTSLPMILGDPNNIMDIVEQMKAYDLVIIDDLGAERQNQYSLEKTFFVIDERYKVGKPLIVTTNQILEDMREMRESGSADYKRIYDRIFEMCTPIAFKGDSRRIPSQRAKRDIVKRLLG